VHHLRAVTHHRPRALAPAPEQRPHIVSPPLPPSTPCHRILCTHTRRRITPHSRRASICLT
jgi:hypothetical protein